jgi:hypothetical protein
MGTWLLPLYPGIRTLPSTELVFGEGRSVSAAQQGRSPHLKFPRDLETCLLQQPMRPLYLSQGPSVRN